MKNYQINNYRHKKIEGENFLTTDFGSHCVLTDKEFELLKEEKIEGGLREKLENRGIILTKKNDLEVVKLTTKRNSFLFRGTSLHIVIITLRCNMNCIYCHASAKDEKSKKYDMDKETAKKTVDFILQSTNQNLTIEFQGGEPLLNFEIIKYIIEYAKEKNKTLNKNLRFSLVTNLTKMTEEKMRYLIKEEIGMCTSLDGPKEIHDYNRTYVKGNNYETVIEWIKKINEEYKKMGTGKRMNALVTLTKKSIEDPKKIIDEYIKQGLKAVHLRFLNNLGVAKKSWKHINYTADEYLEFWKKAINYIEEKNAEGKEMTERMFEIMSNKIANKTDPGYLDLRSPCGAAIGQLAYDHDGKIYTCDEGRMVGGDIFQLGDVKTNNYKEVVTGTKACNVLNASINDQYACDSCVYKPWCGVCPVCNYEEQGNIIAKISQTDRCKIYKEQFETVVKKKFIKKENKQKKNGTKGQAL